ncbi:MAG: D-alanyl-D-alanine carboxypeptidase/D-alanyl-D-alanine-endopeptidase [Cyanobacteria bacterium J06626_18]
MGISCEVPWLVGSGVILGTIALPLPSMALCPADLPAAIEAIASRPELVPARLGIQVETLSGETVYSREGAHFFVPASSLKLLTTATALTQLGPDFTIQTSVYGHTDAMGTTTLQVVGRGDPSFDRDDLSAIAEQLAQQGIRQVEMLWGDESAFQGSAVNSSWEWEDVQAGYGAPVNALILEANEIGLTLVPQAVGEPLQVVWDDPDQGAHWQIENRSITVGSDEPEFVSVGRDLGRPVLYVQGQLIAGLAAETASIAVPNPGEAFLSALQSTLTQRNIPVQQTALTQMPLTSDWAELAVVQSPPLAELLIPANRDSNNLYAEALLKQLGRQSTSEADSTQAGIAIALNTLASLGVDLDTIVMFDGSGLARKNLITPEAMVNTLQAMARSPYTDIYRNSLAVAGISGTLQNRFQDTPIEGRLWGKSGAISRNFSLAGYLEPENYDPLAFSIFINNIDRRGTIARQLIDDIVLEFGELRSCG